MRKVINYFLNSLYVFSLKTSYKNFINTKSSIDIQKKNLLELLEKNKNTFYGKKYNFESITDIEDYMKKVPISTYEDYEEYINSIANGEKNVLSAEKVLLFEPTSGSSSKKKLIPYTKILKQEFQKGINPWLYDVYTNYKGVKKGKSYWSISPNASEKEYSKAGIPIGFEEDGEYLGKIASFLTRFLFAVPKEIKDEKDMEMFYLKTCKYLIDCEDLSLISIWHPSFLLLILEFMEKNIDKLLLNEEKTKALLEKDYYKLWPNLVLISCWTSGNSKEYSQKIEEAFPKTTIQGKGLISTEAFSTFPLMEAKGSVLSIYSHFFEFKSLSDEEIYLCDNLKMGEQYEMILTTSGGFYRYNTQDIVEVKSYYNSIPVIEFIGKNDLIVDNFGEKLNEFFIKKVIHELKLEEQFCLVAFEKDSYVFYTEGEVNADILEKKICKNFHYKYARKLGQLKQIRVFRLNGNPQKEYINYGISRGQKLGDIKINKLIKTSGLYEYLKGEYQ